MTNASALSANFQSPPFLSSHSNLPKLITTKGRPNYYTINSRKLSAGASASASANNGDEKKKTEKRNFLSSEEAGLVEISGLSTHERFLCRLTISSLNLLRVISEQEGCSIEELNAGRVCDWFLKDKLKREQEFESAVLQWDDSDFQF